ncbi:type II/IV secretion system protein [Maribacter polysiphoniae]|uniref:Type II/IV secretion system protein n=1 Tax=Maribacter polysiphoniae TaxID=429344 RepID=A0A316DWV1_9FLAO|nr:GspE/PulE family protein [Maribacter polysiphoniae]MBD1261611.1 type II/IV secretion system protein [Maribacter polysiphoniae]PWK22591.1 type IV pilus assembly protein PilB [Maribacter polysiphoniae]
MELSSYDIPANVKQRITADQAFHYRIVPTKSTDNGLVCKTDNESLEVLLSELQIVLDIPIILEKCEPQELQRLLATNYRIQKQTAGNRLHYTSDFLEKILVSAKNIGSSDIHFEPYEKRCRVRFRLDGKLIEQFNIPLEEYPTIVNKIKIKSDLDIAEKRLPQDGRITMKLGSGEFDIRVSSLPTLHGEKLVLRILSKDTGSIDLDSLGFTNKELFRYKESIRKPNGIVLISGPTGSGKTTTLYATLKHLNNDNTNILTVEDPIEYTLEGINQVQLKEGIGLDFASTLRTFLRQDPDIIMVGEIRDVKTANMAIRAALTGHLVLSTIHTNSAWATISRLIDMGVPSFLIASTLNISVAQRLVRKLCDKCKEEVPIDLSLFPESFLPPNNLTSHYRAVGCNYCHHTGYYGRKAIYEILPISTALQLPIKNNQLEINDYLKEKKIDTLKSNAIQLIKNGTTSIEEVYALLTD